MSQESKEPKEEKIVASPARPPRKEVELFPPVMERNSQYLSTPAPTGTKLGTQISMFQPASFEEALDIVEALRSRHATTISLEKLKKADAGRLVDFVAGASAALDGDFHKMTDHVFLFCPATIKIITSGKSSAGRTAGSTASAATTSALGLSLDALFPAEAQSDKNNWGSLWSRPQ